MDRGKVFKSITFGVFIFSSALFLNSAFFILETFADELTTVRVKYMDNIIQGAEVDVSAPFEDTILTQYGKNVTDGDGKVTFNLPVGGCFRFRITLPQLPEAIYYSRAIIAPAELLCDASNLTPAVPVSSALVINDYNDDSVHTNSLGHFEIFRTEWENKPAIPSVIVRSWDTKAELSEGFYFIEYPRRPKNPYKTLTISYEPPGYYSRYSSGLSSEGACRDISQYDSLSFKAKLGDGTEDFFIRLNYKKEEAGELITSFSEVHSEKYILPHDNYQDISIPLSAFEGLDKKKVVSVDFYIDHRVNPDLNNNKVIIDDLRLVRRRPLTEESKDELITILSPTSRFVIANKPLVIEGFALSRYGHFNTVDVSLDCVNNAHQEYNNIPVVSGRFAKEIPLAENETQVVTARGVDSRGNFASDSLSFTVDACPKIEIESPVEGGFYFEDVSVEGKVVLAEGRAVVSVEVNGAPAQVTVDGFTCTLTDLEKGENEVGVIAQDDSGGKTLSTVRFIYDSTVTALRLLYEGDIVEGADVSVCDTASGAVMEELGSRVTDERGEVYFDLPQDRVYIFKVTLPALPGDVYYTSFLSSSDHIEFDIAENTPCIPSDDALLINDYEDDDPHKNSLGLRERCRTWFEISPAYYDYQRWDEMVEESEEEGVKILDFTYPSEGKYVRYESLLTDLSSGLERDISHYDRLSFRVRKQWEEQEFIIFILGKDEKVDICGYPERYVWSYDYLEPTTEWQDVSIPLTDLFESEEGMKKACCVSFSFFNNGEGVAGSVYIDDLRLERITGVVGALSNHPSNQLVPDVYGDRVVWMDFRRGRWDIHAYDFLTEEEECLTEEKHPPSDHYHSYHPIIYGNKVIWFDSSGSAYMYDFITGEEKPISKYGPMHGDNIVVMKSEDIYVYNLSAETEIPVLVGQAGLRSDAAIYGDRVVWQDGRNGNWDIYMYDLSTGKETRVTDDPGDQKEPQIYGGKIVWHDDRNGNWDIYMYDVETGEETQITDNSAPQLEPDVYGNIIVWQGKGSTGSGIYMYNLSTGETIQITDAPGTQRNPEIHGRRIVWEGSCGGYLNIYAYEIPSGVFLNSSSSEDISLSTGEETAGITLASGPEEASLSLTNDACVGLPEGEAGRPAVRLPVVRPRAAAAATEDSADSNTGYGNASEEAEGGSEDEVVRPQPNRAPVLSILSYPERLEMARSIRAEAGEAVYFIVQPQDPDGDIVSVSMSEGSKELGAFLHPRYHLFYWKPAEAHTGRHILAFIGTDGKDTTTKRFLVYVKTPAPLFDPVPKPQAPTALLKASSLEGEIPLILAFADLSSGEITGRKFTTGDGRYECGYGAFRIRHTYTSAGLYTARLKVMGPGGISEDSLSIEVKEKEEKPATFNEIRRSIQGGAGFVEIPKGTYHFTDNLVIKEGLTLEGEDAVFELGPYSIIIDASPRDSVIFQGITITGHETQSGYGGVPPITNKRGILTLEGCSVVRNRAKAISAVYVGPKAALNLDDALIAQNITRTRYADEIPQHRIGDGGKVYFAAIALAEKAALGMKRSTIADNTDESRRVILQSGYGARYIHSAIEAGGSNDIAIETSVIHGNRNSSGYVTYRDVTLRKTAAPDIYIHNTVLQDKDLPRHRFIRLISLSGKTPSFKAPDRLDYTTPLDIGVR